MTEVVLRPAVRQLEMLRVGEISVVELAEAHIRQIERLNPVLNAFADFDEGGPEQQARRGKGRIAGDRFGHVRLFSGLLEGARVRRCELEMVGFCFREAVRGEDKKQIPLGSEKARRAEQPNTSPARKGNDYPRARAPQVRHQTRYGANNSQSPMSHSKRPEN